MSTRSELDALPIWRAASRCSNGDCVEVALLSSDTIGVRDNKDPDGPILKFSTDEWKMFVKQIRETG
ncbi:DUF397 domain-containing protein [Nonomuraea sp. SYSU D8015]|uniref:DUF397 domain-containing protein n=1 Tax=Nonomuraea sp. SYSU D8015 TaxID=2593644 RepID=UPI001660A458|nr:DUF397 domain-containing protein [Nonomuraea sp. SYSU D8015]